MGNDARLNRVQELMKGKGLDGLIVYSDGTCSILRPSYLHYFAGVRPAGRRNGAVLNGAGEVLLLLEPAWDTPRASVKTWIGRVQGASNFVPDLVALMERMNIRGVVGVAGLRQMTADVYEAVSSKARIEPADTLIEALQSQKTPQEVERARNASRIADAGFHVFLNQARRGVREFELAAEIDYVMRMEGADDVFILLSSSPHNYEMHSPTDRRLRHGDVVIGEITPVVEGQFVQLCRTVVLGEPSAVLIEKYGMLVHAFEESIRELVPGRPSGKMSQTINGIIGGAGYAEYCYPPYMRARGHGFATGSLAPGGVIDDQTEAPFLVDQVVVVHPNQYIPETGYLACGETLLVTEKGPERLAGTDTRLYISVV
jgi:Xaa-Pro dipeptidase